jgi:hypothetical protein
MASLRHSGQLLLLSTLIVLLQFTGSADAGASVADQFSLLEVYSESKEEQCGPELSIETPSCKLVEKRCGYELRLYPEGQVSVVAAAAWLF